MRFPRREFLRLAGAAVALPAVARLARAQAYPARSVRLIIGYPPGGSADITARLMTQWLTERLGQSFIVESRPGGGTNIATEAVINAPPDGYTLLLVAPANAINATLYEKLNHNFLRDIEPVAGLIRFPNVVVVNPSVPVNTIPELIAYAKANPGKLNMASSGNGSTIHMSGELFKMMTGVDMIHVPYRGGALGPDRHDRRAGAGDVRQYPDRSRIREERKVAWIGGDRGDALRGAAGPSDGRGLPAGYEATSWYGLGARKARRRRRSRSSTARSTRSSPNRSEGALPRARRIAAARLARRFRQARRRRNREVGQGGQVRGRQGDLTGGSAQSLRNTTLANQPVSSAIMAVARP
jgi:hypothetical protein